MTLKQRFGRFFTKRLTDLQQDYSRKKKSGHKLPTNTMPGPDDFTSEVYQALKKIDSNLPQNSVDLSLSENSITLMWLYCFNSIN